MSNQRSKTSMSTPRLEALNSWILALCSNPFPTTEKGALMHVRTSDISFAYSGSGEKENSLALHTFQKAWPFLLAIKRILEAFPHVSPLIMPPPQL